MLVLVIFVSCGKKPHIFVDEMKLEGVTQLVLASKTQTIFIDSTIEKLKIFPGLASTAEIRVACNTTYDFYLDFDKDEYEIIFDEEKKELTMNAPAIRMKKPIVNNTEVSYLDTGLFVDEDKEALQIHQNLTDRLVEEGKQFIYEPEVRNKCREQLEKFLRELSSKYNYDVETVIINFADDELAKKINQERIP